MVDAVRTLEAAAGFYERTYSAFVMLVLLNAGAAQSFGAGG